MRQGSTDRIKEILTEGANNTDTPITSDEDKVLEYEELEVMSISVSFSLNYLEQKSKFVIRKADFLLKENTSNALH